MESALASPATAASIRPICFMIMPYGKKPSQSDKGPATIDYNALWDKALFPLIEEDLGYQAVRADQDLGAMIIVEMIERLALADLVIAEVTTPNANVYYEIGVRQAARETGCVLISSDWSKQVFDLAQMRQVRYPMPEGDITDETALAVRQQLARSIGSLITGRSPVFECIPGFPTNMALNRSNSFRQQVDKLAAFSAQIRAIRLSLPTQRLEATTDLVKRHKAVAAAMPGVALEIIQLLRDNAYWDETMAFIDSLPTTTQALPVVREQRCLAQSKMGDHLASIAALEELISLSGDSSERRGLIGGRYKKLYRQTGDSRYLDKAIDQYDKGMRLDLNDYFPSCNLPRLLRTRNEEGDEEQAQAAATVALLACERKRTIDPSDEWALPTLLGAAFDAADIPTAQKLYKEMRQTGIQPFHLDTLTDDLKAAINLISDKVKAGQLTTILENMQRLS